MNEFISMTLKAIMESSLPEKHNELDQSFFRFIDVFRKHHIPLLDIPNYFDGEIKRSDLNDKKALLDKLDTHIIQKTSEMFCVEEGWLKGIDGAEKYKARNRKWYKNISSILSRCEKYRKSGKNMEVFFLLDQKETEKSLNIARDTDGDVEEINITVGLKITDNKFKQPIVAYEIWDYERWNYKGTRLCLKAIVMLTKKAGIRFGGYALPSTQLEKVRSGEAFLSEYFKHGPMPSAMYFPDYIVDDKFNPERDELDSVKIEFESHKLDARIKESRKTLYDEEFEDLECFRLGIRNVQN